MISADPRLLGALHKTVARGGVLGWKNGSNACVRVSLRLESRSWKALKKHIFHVHSFFVVVFLSHARDCKTFTLHDLTDFLRREGESASVGVTHYK